MPALASSFRDPSGFVYEREGVLYRQVNEVYRSDYNLLISSGLYRELVDRGLMVEHEEVGPEFASSTGAAVVLRPERIPNISYPYEWCFGQLKDAALATLEIQRQALARGMWLKDASAYNIQFRGGKPLLIDTLSLEALPKGAPWIAYAQFCRHFLAPLALMAQVDPRLSGLLRVHLDGIPLDLASALLPWKSKLQPGIAMHIHMHARAERTSAQVEVSKPAPRISAVGLAATVDNLISVVNALKWEPKGTEWADYYNETNYSGAAMDGKHRLVRDLIDEISPKPSLIWDLGANTGAFSRLASDTGAEVVAWDVDPAAVELNYQQVKKDGESKILPLVQDLTNPSPSLGWDLAERDSFLRRSSPDLVMALALIHHLAIGNNVPLPKLSAFFAELGEWLVIEFVPKQDSQTQRLLRSRLDIFTDYSETGFESAFRSHFSLVRKVPIPETVRTLYLFRRIG